MAETMQTEEANELKETLETCPTKEMIEGGDQWTFHYGMPMMTVKKEDLDLKKEGDQPKIIKDLFQETKITTKNFRIGVPMMNDKKV